MELTAFEQAHPAALEAALAVEATTAPVAPADAPVEAAAAPAESPDTPIVP